MTQRRRDIEATSMLFLIFIGIALLCLITALNHRDSKHIQHRVNYIERTHGK